MDIIQIFKVDLYKIHTIKYSELKIFKIHTHFFGIFNRNLNFKLRLLQIGKWGQLLTFYLGSEMVFDIGKLVKKVVFLYPDIYFYDKIRIFNFFTSKLKMRILS